MSKLIYANENCPVCFCEYEITNEDEDDYDKVKKYIPVCGHMLCEECRDEIIFCCETSCCPICRVEWDNDLCNDDHLEYPESVNIDDSDDIPEYVETVSVDSDSDDEEIPPKTRWFSSCDYCKQNKFNPEELQEIEQHHFFNESPCRDCRTAFLIHGN